MPAQVGGHEKNIIILFNIIRGCTKHGFHTGRVTSVCIRFLGRVQGGQDPEIPPKFSPISRIPPIYRSILHPIPLSRKIICVYPASWLSRNKRTPYFLFIFCSRLQSINKENISIKNRRNIFRNDRNKKIGSLHHLVHLGYL